MTILLIVLGVIYGLVVMVIGYKGIFGEDNTSPEEDQEQLECIIKFSEREGK